MGIFKRKRSPYYHMSITVDGRRVQKSTGTADKEEAMGIYIATRKKLQKGLDMDQPPTNVGPSTTNEEPPHEEVLNCRKLLEDYLKKCSPKKATGSSKRDQSLVAHLMRHLGHYPLSEISDKEIYRYMERRDEEGAALKTVYNELGLLSRAFNVARKKWGWSCVNPVSDVEKEELDNARDRWIENEEERRLLLASPQWLRDIIGFAVNTGLRRGEILNLIWKHVSFERRTIYIGKQKNKGKNELPLNDYALKVLFARKRVVPSTSGNGFVFCTKDGKRLDGDNVGRAFRKATKRAEIEDIRFHDLRHTFATRMAHAGVDIYKIQRRMRHKTESMTRRYAHHNVESLRDGVESLDRRAGVGTTVGTCAGTRP